MVSTESQDWRQTRALPLTEVNHAIWRSNRESGYGTAAVIRKLPVPLAVELLGFAAATLTSLCWLPQAWRTLRTRDTRAPPAAAAGAGEAASPRVRSSSNICTVNQVPPTFATRGHQYGPKDCESPQVWCRIFSS